MPSTTPTPRNVYQFKVFGDDHDELIRRVDALDAYDVYGAARLASKLMNCCLKPAIFRSHETGELRLVERRCKSRVCPYCVKFRAAGLVANVASRVSRMDSPRFMTLTVRSNDAPLREQLLQLRKYFAKLRKHKAFREHVVGGVYTIEITRNPKNNLWHPHIHAIIDGKFWAQKDILSIWEMIVGDQAGVDIRAVYSRNKAAYYISKYVLKSAEVSHLQDRNLAEWALEVHGLRLMQSFGNLHGVKLEEDEEKVSPRMTEWQDVNDLAWVARSGSELYRRLMEILKNSKQWQRGRNQVKLRPEQEEVQKYIKTLIQEYRYNSGVEKPPAKKIEPKKEDGRWNPLLFEGEAKTRYY